MAVFTTVSWYLTVVLICLCLIICKVWAYLCVPICVPMCVCWPSVPVFFCSFFYCFVSVVAAVVELYEMLVYVWKWSPCWPHHLCIFSLSRTGLVYDRKYVLLAPFIHCRCLCRSNLISLGIFPWTSIHIVSNGSGSSLSWMIFLCVYVMCYVCVCVCVCVCVWPPW